MNEVIYLKLKLQIEANLVGEVQMVLLSEALKSMSVAKHREEIRSNGIVSKEYIRRIEQDFEVESIKEIQATTGQETGFISDLKISLE